jgi:hypothetical protein
MFARDLSEGQVSVAMNSGRHTWRYLRNFTFRRGRRRRGNRLRVFLYGGSTMFTSLDEFRYFDSTMWIQDSGQTLFLVVTSPAVRSKHTSDLSKNTDGMNRVNIRNDIAVRLLVLEQKSAEIGLTALHHLLDGGDDSWIANDDSLVKTGKERTSCNGKSKDLGVDFGHGLFSY